MIFYALVPFSSWSQGCSLRSVAGSPDVFLASGSFPLAIAKLYAISLDPDCSYPGSPVDAVGSDCFAISYGSTFAVEWPRILTV